MHEVVYVPQGDGALLGFAGGKGWRLVPADDARLLADAARGRTPYPAPAVGTSVRDLFAGSDGAGPKRRAWLALAALLGIGAAGVAVYAAVALPRR